MPLQYLGTNGIIHSDFWFFIIEKIYLYLERELFIRLWIGDYVRLSV